MDLETQGCRDLWINGFKDFLLTTLPHKEFFGPLNWPKVTKGSWQGAL